MTDSHLRRRDFMLALTSIPIVSAAAASAADSAAPIVRPASGADDRAYMINLLERMASPLLERMSRGRLQREWSPELSPTWDGRNFKVAYLEAFARLIDGIAPWLSLPDDPNPEGRLRTKLRQQALDSYVHSVDSKSPDYLLWNAEGQPLVDSAYFTSALLRAPDALWKPLDAKTKQRIIEHVQSLRRVSPPYTNWLLFAAMNEVFLLSAGAQWDPMRVDLAIRKFTEWYVGDGWYSDGDRFHLDYYNSFVIHPMLTQILEVLVATDAPMHSSLKTKDLLALQLKRMQRLAEQLERMIGPNGEIAPLGRSLTYRTAVHQPLALLAWRKRLPEQLPEGQARAASLAAQRRMFADPSNFDSNGFLTLGFTRHQPTLANIYSNAGSMYITSESLIALGLPANDSYWTAQPVPWTMQRAYSGQDFPMDNYIPY